METKLIAMILGVALVLMTGTTLGTFIPQAKALYPQNGIGVTNSGAGAAAGHTKPPTITIKHGLGPNNNPFFWVWHKQYLQFPALGKMLSGGVTSTYRSYLWRTVT